MIFVTVGTHEQPFDRLVKTIDKMVENKIITEKVIIQKGYTNYEPIYCESYKLIGYDKMNEFIREARIVITHGGPSSFIAPITIGKVPIVMPRMQKYNEHINNHQLEFVRQVEKRMKNIIVVENEKELQDAIIHYDEKIKKCRRKSINNNEEFNKKLEMIVEKMFKSEEKNV